MPYLGVAVLEVVGRAVGIRVGVAVGDREGALDSAAVGSCEGSPLGVEDGRVVRGNVDGESVAGVIVLGSIDG